MLVAIVAGRFITVMAIRNIGAGDLAGEQPRDGLDGSRIVHDPHSMTNTVLRGKIVNRRIRSFPAFDHVVDKPHALIGQENISCLSADRGHMMDAICFFLGACKLMFFDGPFVVVIYGASTDQSGLFPAIHHQAVDIIARGVFFDQDAFFDKGLQVFLCFIIDFLGMDIYIQRKIDFLFRNMQKGIGIVGGFFAGLMAIKNIVWFRSHVGGDLRLRP